MSLSSNKNYDLQVTGSNVGTWGIVNNGNFSIADLNLGGRLNIDVSGNSDITVTANQAQNLMHILSGTLTGNINYVLPALGGIYMVYNGSSGSFTLTVKVTGGSSGIVVPTGKQAIIFVNPDTPTVYGQVFNVNTYYVGGTSTGSAAAQVVSSVSPSGYSFTAGNLVSFVPGYDSTGATTLAFGGDSARSIKKITAAGGLVDIAAGDIKSSSGVLLLSLGGTSVYVLLNPALGGTSVYVLLNPALGALAYMAFGSNFQNNAGSLDFSSSPVLPSATTATTQSSSDNSTKLATTAFVTTAVAGVVLPVAATQAEQEAASSTTVFVTPGRQQYHPSAAKAWVNLNGGGTASVRAGYNISSATRNSAGSYTINFSVAFSSANYCPVANAWNNGGSILDWRTQVLSASAYTIVTRDNTNAPTDSDYVCVTFHGDQ